MKMIWKWKKTVIFVALLVTIAVLSLSLMAFLPMEIRIEDNNPKFCYDSNAILTEEKSHEIYPNVHLITKVDGNINEVKLMFDDEQYYGQGEGAVDILGFVDGVTEYSGIEIYYMLNTTSQKVLESCPDINTSIDDKTAVAIFTAKALKQFGRGNIKLKIVVKVI